MSIEIQDLEYQYHTENSKPVLNGISLTIEAGEYVGIIGPTGSGKTTLIQHLNGLLKPTKGRICYQGRDIHEKGYPLRNLRCKVGLVFQYPEYQLFELDVLSDVSFGPRQMGCSNAEALKRAKQALDWVKIPSSVYEQSPFTLSGGEKRRVAIAGVLAMEPEVLILDEPAAGLDPISRKNLFAMLEEYHRKKHVTILLVSHNMDEVAEHVQRLLVMKDGRICHDALPQEIFRQGKQLEDIGLAAPQVVYLMKQLEEKGLPVHKGAVTRQEAVTEILQAIKAGQ